MEPMFYFGWKDISSQYGKYMKIHGKYMENTCYIAGYIFYTGIFPSTRASLGTSALDS